MRLRSIPPADAPLHGGHRPDKIFGYPTGPKGATGQLPLALAAPAGMITTVPRALQGDVSVSSGELNLAYFQAPDTAFTAAHAAPATQSVAAATVTLIKVGIYSVADTGDLTLVAASANTTGLFGSTYNPSPVDLVAPAALTPHGTYAVGVLVVATTPPNLCGQYVLSSEAALAPRINGLLTDQTDLPSTIDAGDVSDNWRVLSVRIF